jgi:hypothetical protein
MYWIRVEKKMCPVKGVCPFHKSKVANDVEVFVCEASGQRISVVDFDSMIEITKTIEDSCLGFEYINCKEYKKKMRLIGQ